jgi:hypothetical protein
VASSSTVTAQEEVKLSASRDDEELPALEEDEEFPLLMPCYVVGDCKVWLVRSS